MNHKVEVTLPDWAWGRLATIADNRRTTVGQIIRNAINDVLWTDDARLDELTAELRAARAGGWYAPPNDYKEKSA